MNVKENELTREVSPLATMYLRLVTDLLTGDSKNVSIADLEFAISQITGLQAALDAKQALTTGATDFLAVFNALGQGVTSGLKRVTIADTTELDALYSGIGTVNRSPGITGTDYGVLYGVLALDDTNFGATLRTHASQLGFTSRGVFFRQNILGSWTGWRYTGGGNQNIPVTRAELAAIVAANSLSPGATYRISDHPYYMYIILTAASGNTFEPTAQAYAACPIHRYGTYTIDGDGVTFVGQWAHNLGNAIGNISIHGNRCYINLTGARGTQTAFVLDSTNWGLIDIRTGKELYAFEWHTISYDYTNDYVREEWDGYGNRFGDITIPTPDDGFRCHMNDWGLNYEYDETNKIIFKENTLTRLYGTTPTLGEGYNNIITIKGNNGTGSIKDYLIPDNTTPGATPVVHFEIMDNIFFGDTLPADNVVNGKAAPIIDSVTMMQYGAYPVYNRICGNRIYPGGKITGVYRVVNQHSCTIADNDIKDVIRTSAASSGFPASMKGLHIARSTIGGSFEASYYDGGNESTVSLVNTVIHAGAVIKATANGYVSITDSVLYSSRTFTASASRKESKGFIFASLYIGTGEFSFDRDASFHAPTVQTGCLLTSVGSNGITVAGTDINSMLITFIHAGWYSVEYNASALSAVGKLDVESLCYNGATAIQDLYNKKTYTAIDEWINASISGYVYFSAGDTLSCKYRASGTGICTLELGQININIEYKGQ